MNDRYLFRGKRLDNREWVYGVPIYDGGGDLLIITEVMSEITCCSDCGMPDVTYHIVNLATLGQYTGIKDKNGKMIFDGDILWDSGWETMVHVHWDSSHLAYMISIMSEDDTEYLQEISPRDLTAFPVVDSVEVVGNIHDNSHLLKEDTNAEID